MLNQYTTNEMPLGVRLALTGVENEMRISWYTSSQGDAPSVQYSTTPFNPSDMDAQAMEVASNNQYTEIAWKGFSVSAVLTQLTPLTTYYYSVGDKSVGIWSPLYNFTTHLEDDGTFTPFTFVSYGDMGLGGGFNFTIANIVNRIDELSFALHIGDIAYADIRDAGELLFGNQTVWNEFLAELTPISTKIPYMTAIGNHDLFSIASGVYRKTFLMPGSNDGKTWYSFDYNGVHFVAVSTEHDYIPTSSQYRWLENELKNFRENNPTGWLIVYAHRPVYCSAHYPWCDGRDPFKVVYVDSIEHLYQKYNVDVYLSGHSHVYERSLPVYKNQVLGDYSSPKAPIHLVVGTGGNQEGILHSWQPQPNWSSGTRLLTTGYGLMSFVNETTLHWQFVKDTTNQVLDELYITKGYFN
ncbi:hypothetical protein PPL_09684 [Heterostelium album PN500]|uniref:Purple acid phosphatase n=1 Tax=Heterostelium pallidum (strain ATCC 26659 / Pp 5 / PN500) TaxID=670386 RepID=D3BNI1_HETP5|nr:hypothetical protein PPL_09684 [Heterostelium album PN500]EFA76932.1 hypothetical protein PPL_09684 [Heterostelium album PN500]|eukprot:XP_020429064.1 hypothetical protein PPL_09684 [Heterostelium album PN500]